MNKTKVTLDSISLVIAKIFSLEKKIVESFKENPPHQIIKVRWVF